jgi:hypothetical protein
VGGDRLTPGRDNVARIAPKWGTVFLAKTKRNNGDLVRGSTFAARAFEQGLQAQVVDVAK